MTLNDRSVMVAMSGGVDSAVCTQLLKDAGYSVHCVFFVMSDAHERIIPLAEAACEGLNVPLRVMDLRDLFSKTIIEPFCEAYCSGTTPNPCIRCNPAVKFKALCDAADDAGCRWIATGHYARTEQTEKGTVLLRGTCHKRDQSYMLYSLTQEQLSRLIMPLGGMNKDEVRAIAEKNSLSCAKTPDSQENCFIPENDYITYLESRGYRGKQGNFLSPDGKTVCPHKGVHCYTIGQRRGLGVALGKPVFVKSILDNGDIQLAWSGEEYSSGVRCDRPIFNPHLTPAKGDRCEVRLRSVAQPAPCTVADISVEGFSLLFDEPQRAPAPGQSAVLLIGETVIGGGEITSCF